MLISVIIPVYNLEKYVARAIESVLAQSYPHIEIIIVDDGSVDSSGAICEEYATRYEQISVIHQENRGLSIARNEGIKRAKGEYITFVDSDDEIDGVDTLERNIQFAKEEKTVDFIQFPMREVDIDSQEIIKEYAKNPSTIKSEEEYLRGVLNFAVTNNACGKIYRADIFEEYLFEDNMICEDALFNISISGIIKHAVISDIGFYRYNIRSNSIMTGLKSQKFYEGFLKHKRLVYSKSQKYSSLHGLIVDDSARLLKLYYELPRQLFRTIAPMIKQALPPLSILRGCRLRANSIARAAIVTMLKIHSLTIKG